MKAQSQFRTQLLVRESRQGNDLGRSRQGVCRDTQCEVGACQRQGAVELPPVGHLLTPFDLWLVDLRSTSDGRKMCSQNVRLIDLVQPNSVAGECFERCGDARMSNEAVTHWVCHVADSPTVD